MIQTKVKKNQNKLLIANLMFDIIGRYIRPQPTQSVDADYI